MAVQLRTKEQLHVLMDSEYDGRLYVDADLLLGKEGHVIRSCLLEWKQKKEERAVYPVLPLVIRLLDEPYLQQLETELLKDSLWDGMMVRNMESLYYLKEKGWKKEILADANLYTWNQWAKSFRLTQSGDHVQAMSLWYMTRRRLLSAVRTEKFLR